MELKEDDIRPQDLLNKYLELSRSDAELMFNGVSRRDIACVACGSKSLSLEFEKNSFVFKRCDKCGTLFQTPRPDLEAFERFYKDSISSEFWAKEFFPTVAEVRRTAIFEPRARSLAELLKEKGFSAKTIVDVGAGHGVFLDSLMKAFSGAQGIAVEPSADMAASCKSKGYEVFQALAEEVDTLSDCADLTCALEVMEHVHDPLAFLSCLAKFTRPGGAVFFTTLGCDGFDIQVLGKNSNAVSPPHHLNFLSVDGFVDLCQRAGLEDVQVLTPGKLDVDIVRNKFQENPELKAENPFISKIIDEPKIASAFQEFLASNQMSSHTWVLARKPIGEKN